MSLGRFGAMLLVAGLAGALLMLAGCEGHYTVAFPI